MNVPLLADLARSRARLLGGLLVALFAMTILYLAMYPSIEAQLQQFARDLPDAISAFIGDADLATPAGYLQAEVFALLSPLLLSALAIAVGVALSRAEHDQTLTPTFFAPLRRRTLAVSHLTAVWVVALTGGAVIVVGVLAGTALAGIDVPLSGVLAAVVQLVAFAGLMGTVAFAAGAATGSPTAGLGAGWGLLAVSFVANSLADLVDALGWLEHVSPWSWYGTGAPITDGLDAVGLALLLGLALVATVVGVHRFERRDLDL